METYPFDICFTVPGLPVGKGRPRVTRFGAYTPEKTRAYEEKVRQCWETQSGTRAPEGAAVMAEIIAWFPIPKATPKGQRDALEGAYHLKRPDCDNIAKAVLDSLNGYAYKDDSAVQLRIEKRYTNGAPRVSVRLHSENPSETGR